MTDAERLIQRFFDTQMRRDFDAWADCWTVDAVFETPYAPEGFPERTAGRDAIVDGIRDTYARFRDVAYTDIEVFGTGPRIALTWRVRIVVPDADYVYDSRNTAIAALRDGRIAHLTEFFDPTKFARAAGLD